MNSLRLVTLLSASLALLGACSSPPPNAAPVIEDPRLQITGERRVALSFRAADPDRDSLTCSVSWGDGTAPQAVSCAGTDLTHIYSAYGSYQVTVRAADAQTSAQETLSVTLLEAPRTQPRIVAFTRVAPGTDATSLTGTVRLVANDGGAGQALTCTLNWGDNTPDEPVPCANDVALTRSHPYSAPGDYAVLLVVRDSQGQEVTRTIGVRVGEVQGPVNAPPVILMEQVPSTLDAAWPVRVQVDVQDPENAPLSCRVNWGDNTGFQTVPCTSDGRLLLDHLYPGPGDYAVLFEVDDGKNKVSKTLGVKVGRAEVPVNAPPALLMLQVPSTLDAAWPVRVQIDVQDPENAPLSCRVNWGDNTGFQTVPCTSGGRLLLDHLYPGPGDYAVLFEVEDGQNKVSKTLGVKVGRPPQ
ncbi:PKD domain-containing protein [Deinococcus sp. NW-56]|uniref:PKD domain-containing protein n=1 Tax=Deinococcus sp. NW-56 TaxID=2080419 RepID=UPI000CF4CB46|nr:PKD domain-containing protein [Deinococcus sp. NW-56]